jgi:hypothetical protein
LATFLADGFGTLALLIFSFYGAVAFIDFFGVEGFAFLAYLSFFCCCRIFLVASMAFFFFDSSSSSIYFSASALIS